MKGCQVMEKRRGNPIFLVLMILLLIIGLVVLFWGAATYVKPRIPFGGPPAYLLNIITEEYLA
jgi:hypothetical protein